jgi:hypothetical protein
MTLRWPDEILRPQNVAFDIAARTLAAPSSVSGVTQVVATDAGVWKATYGNVLISKRDQVNTFRGISVLLEGRLGSILVPLCRAYQPVPEGAIEAGAYDTVPHSDLAFFSDGTGYVIERVIDVVAGANAAVRAISIQITIVVAGTIEPGQHFSIGERLYRVRTVNYTSSTVATLTFRPPLREAVTAGERLEFEDPVCRMRLATDDAMDLELSLRRFAQPTVMFIEDI